MPENLHGATQTREGHCGTIMREGWDLTFTWGEYSNFYSLSWRGRPTFSTQGEARVDRSRPYAVNQGLTSWSTTWLIDDCSQHSGSCHCTCSYVCPGALRIFLDIFHVKVNLEC